MAMAAVNKFKISTGGVQLLRKKHRSGESLERRSGSGRPSKLSAADVRRLKREALENRKKTFVDHAKDFRTRDGSKVSRFTIQRHLKTEGLTSHSCANVPMISKANRKKRTAWCKRHKDDDFSVVIWSDEKRFCLVSDQPERCVRRIGERFRPECTHKTVKGNRGFMVWGCFSRNGMGNLYRVPNGETVNGEIYQSILQNQLIPSIKKLHPDRNYVFMQDNAPCHVAKAVIAWMKQKKIKFWDDWPPCSPDINPIENLWQYIDKKVHQRTYTTLDSLWDNVLAIWNSIPRDIIQRHVDSVNIDQPKKPCRLKLVISAKGNPTEY